MKLVSKLFKDESGATAIEYGLIAALISVVAIFALTTVGEKLQDIFGNISDKLDVSAGG